MRSLSGKHVTTTAILAVTLLFVWVAPALGGTANSSYSNFTCDGYGYRNMATVITDSNGARAGTLLMSSPAEYRPAGWYGVYCRLYDDNGALKKYSGYYYTGGSATGIQMFTGNYTAAGNYYSQGITKSYTGSSYHSHATWSSPRQTN